jgi:hypothetical protein
MDAKTIEAVAAESGITKDEVSKVIQSLESLTEDPKVGTVVRNPDTGDVAIFVRQYTQTYWRVVSSDDRSWVETEPRLGWDALFEDKA